MTFQVAGSWTKAVPKPEVIVDLVALTIVMTQSSPREALPLIPVTRGR